MTNLRLKLFNLLAQWRLRDAKTDCRTAEMALFSHHGKHVKLTELDFRAIHLYAKYYK
jgi:hypothetical protein